MSRLEAPTPPPARGNAWPHAGESAGAPRRGAALIIAIAVLAALLFLALPFLFSQSASVAGARAAAWDGVATRTRLSAEGIAAATAVYATGLVRTPSLPAALGSATLTYTSLPGQIGNALGIYACDDNTLFRAVLDGSQPWTDASNSVLRPAIDDPAQHLSGMILEDEGRRIDPNGLGEQAWAVILERAKISDPHTVQWSWTPGPGGLSLAADGQWTMVGYGRLARALARHASGTGRYAVLQDLLGADPASSDGLVPITSKGWTTAGVPNWPVTKAVIEATRNDAEYDTAYVKFPDTTQQGYRLAKLTQVELERLRPYLSFHCLAQARSGLTDLGSIIAIDPRQNEYGEQATLFDLPTDFLNGSPHPLMRNGAWVRDEAGNLGFQGFGQSSSVNVTLGQGLGLLVAPEVNINAIPGTSDLTRLYYNPPSTSPAPPVTGLQPTAWPARPDFTSLHAIPLLSWLDPRSGDGFGGSFEHPPIGVAGWGIVTVEGSGLAVDPSGHAQAQRRRRIVMQTVPQERPIERAWTTQADLEALVRQRQGSWIVAGPRPTNRIAAWGSDATSGAQDMADLGKAGWLEPQPLAPFSSNLAVNFDWRADFGLTSTRSWLDVLNAGSVPPVETLDPRTTLTPQGLIVDNTRLAYSLASNAPLTFASASTVYGNWQEMSARHLALRFAVRGGSAGASSVGDLVLLESRARDGSAGDINQSLWRVEYRKNTTELVLIIANSAKAWTSGERSQFASDVGVNFTGWTMGTDSPTADEDARCRPDAALAFAPADPGTRVEFHYQVQGGLAFDRWYHLQVLCAGDQPGQHGLILDGVVGRDAIAAGATVQTGDHYTFPSCRLTNAIPASDPATNGAVDLAAGTIQLDRPSSTLALSDILPPRGLVRIDDEYFSYTGISANGLTGIQRARRQNTNQSATVTVMVSGTPTQVPSQQCWPVTQAHAAGALVVPGWSQSWISGGRWLRGQVTLADDFTRLPTSETVTVTFGWDANGATPLAVTGTWPDTGFVRFWSGTICIGRAAFSGGLAKALTLDWTADPDPNPATNVCFRTGVFGTIRCELVSMKVVGGTGLADQDITGDGVTDTMFLANNGRVQLLDASTGRCEWIRYSKRVVVSNGSAAGQYLVNIYGESGTVPIVPDSWDMPDPPSSQQPLVQGRGSMRTPWRSASDGPWPSGTIVLPVQTGFQQTDRFEDGDVVTVVPRDVSATVKPVRCVIRHAARDGFGGAGTAYDTSNEWFALAHRVPDAMPDPVIVSPVVALQALIGRGWSGDDLSMVGNAPPRRGAMPRLPLLSTAGSTDARIYVGCADPLTAADQSLIIDDLCAGTLPGISDANAESAPAQGRLIAIEGLTAGVIPATAGSLPLNVTASTGVFQLPQNLQYGLAWIDGEVFAFRRGASGTQAVLIARALLGSTRMEHDLLTGPQAAISNGPSLREVDVTLPIIPLPMGPVAELCGNFNGAMDVGNDIVENLASTYFRDPAQNTKQGRSLVGADGQFLLQAPIQVIMPADAATAPEAVKLFQRPASNQLVTAPWLRGLYGTSAVQSWTSTYAPAVHQAWDEGTNPPNPPPVPTVTWPGSGSGQVNPIVVGWWPRFAPDFTNGAAGSDQAALWRSRCFAWASFPLRLHGARFDPGDPNTPSTRPGVGVLQAGGILDAKVTAGGTSVVARALAAGPSTGQFFDWDQAPESDISTGTSHLTAPFAWIRFFNREVDGADLRIGWRRSTNASGLAAIADTQGRAVRLGATDAETSSPPAAGAGIRLRCVAPTRILAIEEVR